LIYFDTSALVKFLIQEPESADLAEWLVDQGQTIRASSAVVRVEVLRAVGTRDPARVTRARDLLRGLVLVPLGNDLLDDAGALPYPLRSLDAIHLTSALRLRGGLSAFVAYDKQLLAAAELAGLPIASPGAS
jgi:uncharacterized protein